MDRLCSRWSWLSLVALMGLILLPQTPVALGEAVRGPDQRIEELLARMTLEEKTGQLTQYSGGGPTVDTAVGEEQRQWVAQGHVGSLLNVVGAEATREIQRVAVEESRLGIPLLLGLDVIHGYRTTFPVPLAESCSWDPEAVERAARVAATEATAAGLHWTFAPMVDIARDPRWGRIVEGSGEDPYLGSVMAAARVRGFQGQDPMALETLLACAKHFVAYGGAEGGRDYNSVDISQRTLREIYLPPFHAAVAAGAETVMGGFNEIAGIPMHMNRQLLTSTLREAWGFDGFVVSDWNAIGEMLQHRVAASRGQAGGMALRAGVDMDMMAGIYHQDLAEQVRAGAVDEALVDQAVRRVLQAKLKLGLFDDPYRYSDVAREKELILNPAHLAAARDMARQSIVLLKNEGPLLPLRKDLGTLAVLGPLADDREAPLGPWSAQGRPEEVVSVLEGIRAAVASTTTVLHAPGCKVEGDETAGIDEAVGLAARADAVILVLGETAPMSGEGGSRSSLDLPGVQGLLAQAVFETGKPVIVVLMNGRPLSVSWIAENIPAIVESWFLGVQTGPAVADVLFGDFNPAGKLTTTFPRTVGQVPIHYNHKNTGRPGSLESRNNSRYLDLPLTPLYPFGHGLSYTEFRYADLKIDATQASAGETVKVALTVENTGARSGGEVVQLYVRDLVASVAPPVKALKGFQRVHLAAGEKKVITFALPVNLLALYNPEMNFVLEPGRVDILVGSSSEDIRLQGTIEIVGPVAPVDATKVYFTEARIE